MSFDFGSNNINQFKAQAAYKDGGGMGGGGMYMNQRKKRKDEPDEDLFEFSDKQDENSISFGQDIDDKDIPTDNFYNKFVNWFQQKKNN